MALQPPFITGEYYHIFNRGIDRRPIFTTTTEYKQMLQSMYFYLSSDKSLKLSHYLAKSRDNQQQIDRQRTAQPPRISLLAYCLMPNHFHLLVQQQEDYGVYDYMRMVQSSYAHRFNLRHKRRGALFESVFKAVHIETDEQLIHVSRYIHLNPHTAHLVNGAEGIMSYPWSSLSEYCNGLKSGIINTQTILGSFVSVEGYANFVLNQADYQRKLKTIEHLALE